ncbi:MAG TPA: BTAD domain-containing putative transcriptional regulator [Actinomycetota bacterium]|nr:BTAD domain-containing putative transcriptional regulator [Actinomycetota bacterium]
MEIWLLGRFVVRRGHEEIPPRGFGGRRVRTLIRVLASRRGELVPKEALADALWTERLPTDPAANLEVLIHRARRALGDPSLITTGPGGYAFTGGEGCLIDAEEFRELVEAGRTALAEEDWAGALGSFGRALEWWRGEPLMEDVYADWAQPVRAELRRLHLEALEGGAAAALRVGDLTRAVEFAEMAVAREPLREAGRLLLMRALYLSGDRAGALRAFEELRRGLAEDLGVDPSPEASQLHVEMLRGHLRAEAPLRRAVTGGAVDEELKGTLGGAGSAPVRSLVLSRMASFAAGADDYRRALRLAELALAEAGDDEPARAEALAAMAVIDMNLGHLEDCERRCHEALALFDHLGDRHGRARILDLRAMMTFLAGHIRAGVEAFGEIADLFEETGDFLRSITPRSTRGHGLVHLDLPQEALAEIDRALQIATDLRHREMTCYCLWHRSEALAALGRAEEAIAAGEAALGIARELNHREWTAVSTATGIPQMLPSKLPTRAGDKIHIGAITPFLVSSMSLRCFRIR